MDKYGMTIGLGILMGTLARAYMLRSDYRQYPGYPHGYVTHMSLGFIAAALGSVAIPSLVEKEFTAVTFLALASQQFREVRNIERESLAALEKAEIVPRGPDYIEGIARVFEARNFLVIVTALVVSSINYFTHWPLFSIMIGLLFIVMLEHLMKGKEIGDIAVIKKAELIFDGPLLKIGEIGITNIGLPSMREKIIADGLGIIIHPKDDNSRATIHNMGQRQAIAHTISVILGTKKDIDTPEFTTLLRKNVDTGAVAMFCIPTEKDIESLIAAVERVPVLESAYRAPLKTKSGRIASD
jgi:hypothetical protein